MCPPMSPEHASHDSLSVAVVLYGRMAQPVAFVGTGLSGALHRAGLRRWHHAQCEEPLATGDAPE